MVRLLRYRSLTSLSSDSSNLRRAFSETTLQTSTLSDTRNTFLRVNQTQITVGEKVVVSWNIKEPTSDKDWIGLFYEGINTFVFGFDRWNVRYSTVSPVFDSTFVEA